MMLFKIKKKDHPYYILTFSEWFVFSYLYLKLTGTEHISQSITEQNKIKSRLLIVIDSNNKLLIWVIVKWTKKKKLKNVTKCDVYDSCINNILVWADSVCVCVCVCVYMCVNITSVNKILISPLYSYFYIFSSHPD